MCKTEELINIKICPTDKIITSLCLHRRNHAHTCMEVQLALRLKPCQLRQKRAQSEATIVFTLLLICPLTAEDQSEISSVIVSKHLFALHPCPQKTIHTF